jgi:hypothetical protein
MRAVVVLTESARTTSRWEYTVQESAGDFSQNCAGIVHICRFAGGWSSSVQPRNCSHWWSDQDQGLWPAEVLELDTAAIAAGPRIPDRVETDVLLAAASFIHFGAYPLHIYEPLSEPIGHP